jgi:hypothetical protein
VAIVSALIAGCADGHRVAQDAPPAKDDVVPDNL